MTADLSTMITTSINTTVELYVKTCQDIRCQGAIFTYAVTRTFAIWNRKTIVITYGDFYFDTGFELENDRWNQIAVVWKKAEYRLELYVFNGDGVITGVTTLSDDNILPTPNPFKMGGKMSLGRWQPASKDPGAYSGNDNFKGCIDELRIWHK